MKSIKFFVSAILGLALLAPAALWAAKPSPELCPCWYEGEDNGIWGAIEDVDFDVTILRFREYDLKPDDFFVQLEVVEGVYPYEDPPDPSICEEMWVTTKWQPTYETYYCEVRIYDWGHVARTPVNEPLTSELQFKSCIAATRLLRQKAMDY